MKGKISPVLPKGPDITFEYNPSEFESSKAVPYAEIGIPGLDSPIQQFIRGGLRTLSLEIYFNQDGYTKSWDVRGSVGQLEKLVEKTTQTMAPPVCLFSWGAFQFVCVIGSISTRYTMFDPQGTPIEATISLSLRQYAKTSGSVSPTASPSASPASGAARPPAFNGAQGSGSVFAPPQEGGLAAAEQLTTAGTPSLKIAQKGESLQAMATEAYGNPGVWRAVEVANRTQGASGRFRDVDAGAEMVIPDPTHPIEIIEKVTAFSSDTIARLREGQNVGVGAVLA